MLEQNQKQVASPSTPDMLSDTDHCGIDTIYLTLEELANHVDAMTSYVSQDSGDHQNFGLTIDQGLILDGNCVELVEMIKEGSRSTIYLGLYKSKHVAVKVPQPEETTTVTPGSKGKFEREVGMFSRVKHQNIVEFIGVTMKPITSIILELMKGGTLQRYLWNTRPRCLDLELVVSFALDISRAMEYLHAKGIIHRDLKPANLLLTEDKKHVKLANFGVAREEVTDEMTSEVGTYRWMAPEIFNLDPVPIGAKKHYDHKVDVYSFSMVLWELITNQTIFKGRSDLMAAYATVTKVRPSLENFPPKLVPLIESCWSEDPCRRPEFQEITIFLTDFQKSLSPAQTIPPQVFAIEDPNIKSNSDFAESSQKRSEKIKEPNRESIGFGQTQPEEKDVKPDRESILGSSPIQPEEKDKILTRESSVSSGQLQLEEKDKKLKRGSITGSDQIQPEEKDKKLKRESIVGYGKIQFEKKCEKPKRISIGLNQKVD